MSANSKSPEEQKRLKEPRPEDLLDPIVQRFLAAEPVRHPLLKGPKVLARRGAKEVKRRAIVRREPTGMDWKEQARLRKMTPPKAERVRRTWTLRKSYQWPCKRCGLPLLVDQVVAKLVRSGDTVHIGCAPTSHLERAGEP